MIEVVIWRLPTTEVIICKSLERERALKRLKKCHCKILVMNQLRKTAVRIFKKKRYVAIKVGRKYQTINNHETR